eukprot:7377680-Prymnesium_polylepis.1
MAGVQRAVHCPTDGSHRGRLAGRLRATEVRRRGVRQLADQVDHPNVARARELKVQGRARVARNGACLVKAVPARAVGRDRRTRVVGRAVARARPIGTRHERLGRERDDLPLNEVLVDLQVISGRPRWQHQ